MKPLLIAKTGTTFSSIRGEQGDFEHWILKLLPFPTEDCIVAPVVSTKQLPEAGEISGVIITGSHAMVTDREDWSETLAAWLRTLPAGLPVLGICYGHQLLAHAFGGEVGYHPRGIEIGTVGIELTAEGQSDPLLGCLPKAFTGYVTHAQTVTKLPPEAKLLARNSFEPHHAFVVRDNMWGVQFHPEFTAGILRAYIEVQSENLASAGHSIEHLQTLAQEVPYGKTLLTRFGEIVRGRAAALSDCPR